MQSQSSTSHRLLPDRIGPLIGALAPDFDTPWLRKFLPALPADLKSGAAPFYEHGSARLYRRQWSDSGRTLEVAIKCHAGPGGLRNLVYRRSGSPARRAGQTALDFLARGVRTPAPVAWLERWDGSRLLASYEINVFEDHIASFRDELIRLYASDPDSDRLMTLLETVAGAVRQMHDAGIRHRDLGNQNILLRHVAPAEWRDVMFIDLNRARVGAPLTARGRAVDLARLHLPSDFLRIFHEMYYQAEPPADFKRWARRAHRLYQWHSLTRKWRHPIKARTVWRRRAGAQDYPPPRDLWIWDEKSVQAITTMASRERHQNYSWRNHLATAGAAARSFPRAWRRYAEIQRTAFTQPVPMSGTAGLALTAEPATLDRELELLAPLGKIPVLLRCYHHRPAAALDFTLAAARRLHALGHPVALTLVQDRRAVLEPRRWTEFCNQVVAGAGGFVDFIQAGQALNRVKWGVWNWREYRQLLEPLAEAKRRQPHLQIAGPAMIDFEYHYVLGALDHLPAGFRFDALAHLLYVDRRGAPERRQGRFDAVAKFCLARAIAGTHRGTQDRLIVTEFNWPIQGAGIWSPVCSPWMYPGRDVFGPPVSEAVQADYMVRYLLLAACSGMVERAYWWRLAARGFGLVDDQATPNWRTRPAYRALCHYRKTLADARYEARVDLGPGIYCLRFCRADGEVLALAWASEDARDVALPFSVAQIETPAGEPLPLGKTVRLTGSPIYFRGLN